VQGLARIYSDRLGKLSRLVDLRNLAARIPECVIISALDSNLTPLG